MIKSKKSKIEPFHVEEADRLRALFKERAGTSQDAFGATFGIGTQGMVWQYLNAKSPLNLEAAVKFARGLRCSIEDFSPRLADEHRLAPTVNEKGIDPQSIDPNAEPAGRPRTMHPVKIKGFAKLGDNGYYEEVECDGWVDSYSPDPDAYGLRVKGDSMHPAIRNGSVVVIEPRGQLVPGEYVAIALTNGKKMVKELVFDRHDEIVVESVNGNQRMTIERKNIAQIQPVAAVVSPSKWRPE